MTPCLRERIFPDDDRTFAAGTLFRFAAQNVSWRGAGRKACDAAIRISSMISGELIFPGKVPGRFPGIFPLCPRKFCRRLVRQIRSRGRGNAIRRRFRDSNPKFHGTCSARRQKPGRSLIIECHCEEGPPGPDVAIRSPLKFPAFFPGVHKPLESSPIMSPTHRTENQFRGRDSNPRRLRRHGVSGTCSGIAYAALRASFGLFHSRSAETPSVSHLESHRKKIPEGIFFLWAIRDSNPGPTGYEPGALTN